MKALRRWKANGVRVLRGRIKKVKTSEPEGGNVHEGGDL